MVKVKHQDTVRLHQLQQLALKKAAVVGVGQHIAGNLAVIVAKLLHGGGLRHCAQIEGGIVLTPDAAQGNAVPVQLAVNGQQHRKLGVGVGTGGRVQRLLDAADILPREAGFVNILR